MIHVKRPAPPPSLDLDNPESAASRERATCRQIFGDTGKPPPAATFEVYADRKVRETLTDLFHGKCAYCESPISGSSQTDIEHYRPKGGVQEFDGHPGYWWLAMEWSNLVLSCMHCNQKRRQLNLKPNLTEQQYLEAIRRNDLSCTGKKNHFPTAGDVWVTDHAADLDAEKPLLIDPTSIDPEPLFEWRFTGTKFSTVKASGGDPRAEKTIQVLGFNRRYLTEARVKSLNNLRRLGSNVRAGLKDISRARTEEGAEMARRAVRRDLAAIRDMGCPDQPYAAMARAYLRKVQAMVATML
jgi:5-methylcytosine-specific restriction endonuclease McrA